MRWPFLSSLRIKSCFSSPMRWHKVTLILSCPMWWQLLRKVKLVLESPYSNMAEQIAATRRWIFCGGNYALESRLGENYAFEVARAIGSDQSGQTEQTGCRVSVRYLFHSFIVLDLCNLQVFTLAAQSRMSCLDHARSRWHEGNQPSVPQKNSHYLSLSVTKTTSL